MARYLLYRREFDTWDTGAAGDGVRDDTEALQSLLDGAQGLIEVPTGIYRTTAPLVVSGAFYRLVGTQPRECRIVADHDGPVFILKAGATTEWSGIENLGIEGGSVGVQIEIGPDTTLSKGWLERCWIRQNSGYGVELVNTRYDPVTAAGADGLFQYRIWDNVIEGGISLVYGGDSLWVERNIVLGGGIVYDGVQGAKLTFIRDNVLLRDGGIRIGGGLLQQVTGNHVELGESGWEAAVDIVGSPDQAGPAQSVTVANNNVDCGARFGTGIAHCVRVGAAVDTAVDRNYLMLGTSAGVKVEADAAGTVIGQIRNRYIDDSNFSDTAPSIWDLGIGTTVGDVS